MGNFEAATGPRGGESRRDEARPFDGKRDWLYINSDPPRPSRATLLECVCTVANVSAIELRAPWRWRSLQPAKFAYAWLARSHTKASFPAIAKLINRDHSTIVHSYQQVHLHKSVKVRNDTYNIVHAVEQQLGLPHSLGRPAQ